VTTTLPDKSKIERRWNDSQRSRLSEPLTCAGLFFCGYNLYNPFRSCRVPNAATPTETPLPQRSQNSADQKATSPTSKSTTSSPIPRSRRRPTRTLPEPRAPFCAKQYPHTQYLVQSRASAPDYYCDYGAAPTGKSIKSRKVRMGAAPPRPTRVLLRQRIESPQI